MRVIRRNRIGNNTEDITYTPGADRRVETVAILDGYNVLGVSLPRLPADAPAPTPAPGGGAGVPFKVGGFGQPAEVGVIQEQTDVLAPMPRPGASGLGQGVKLFDLRGLNILSGPRGIAYIESEGLYVFNDPNQRSTLLLADGAGRPHDTRAIKYLGGFTPQHVEGLAYVPPSSRLFPDHLVMVALTLSPNLESRLEVLQRDGQVVKEIHPGGQLGGSFITGVCFKAPNQLLVSTDDDNVIHTLDFDGNVIPPVPIRPNPQIPSGLPLHGIEGLVQVTADVPRDSGGFVAAAGYDDGILVLIPPDLDPQPRQFCNYRVGIGLSQPTGLAWDSTTNQHIILSSLRGHPASGRFIATVAPTLTSGRPLTNVGTGKLRLAYLPDEKLIAAPSRTPPAILLYDDQGKLVEEVDIPSTLGTPFALAYLPTTREFVLRVLQQPATLLFLSRKGANVTRTLDLKPAGVRAVMGLAFFNPQHPTGGQFLVLDVLNHAVITDLNGTKLGEFDARKELNVVRSVAVSAITTGPDAGAFAVTDPDNSEIVVFRID